MRRKLLAVFVFTGLTLAAVAVMAVPAQARPHAALAQADPGGALAPALAALVLIVGALVISARGITYLVDRVRDVFPRASANPKFKVVWPLLALAIALFATLGFDGTNLIGDALAKLPRGTNALEGTFGKVVTAVALAGIASSWHDRDKAKNPPDEEVVVVTSP